MSEGDLARLKSWATIPSPRFIGGNQVELLQGGDALFPRMEAAIDAATAEVWLATYIFHDDPAATAIAAALSRAATRGVAVHVVVDGFGTRTLLAPLRALLAGTGVELEVFRPLDRWYAWFQPGQLRRLHHKLCVCDGVVAFVGGINLIDDRHDLRHGWTDTPRLDFAVQLRGPLVQSVHDTARAMWARAHLARAWRHELSELVKSDRPVAGTIDLVKTLRSRSSKSSEPAVLPVRAAFLVRDNLRQRRTIERSYVEAIRRSRVRVDIAVPYFYPGRSFRRVLRNAAKRGVQVRLLLQGRADYRIAAMAARALYDELRAHGVHIYEYTPAFLHAKVAVVDAEWATVGSSNIDPLSLLLNLEANVMVRDPDFAAALTARFEQAYAVSTEIVTNSLHAGWRNWLNRGAVAWAASVYMRIAGITGRY
ncbi:MAG: cardiolipin synthase ClsB [Pseudomonadota bacterium]|nr:cardiolipin synthase ClsB [Pseudomonadota bacterium]